MPPEQPYELVLAPPAVRALTAELPEAVATAVVEFMTGVLVQNPDGVGKPLRADLAGVWVARRGTYRGLYRISDERREVIVARVEHRRLGVRLPRPVGGFASESPGDS